MLLIILFGISVSLTISTSPTRSQFQVAMLFEDSTLLDRMFRVFDKNDDNVVSFAEYVTCLSVISSKGTKEDKTKCKYLSPTPLLRSPLSRLPVWSLA